MSILKGTPHLCGIPEVFGSMDTGQLKPFFLHLFPKANGRRTTVAEPGKETKSAERHENTHRNQDKSWDRRIEVERQPGSCEKEKSCSKCFGHKTPLL